VERDPGDPDGYRHKRKVLEQHCAAVGRDPATIRRSLMVPMAIGSDRADAARRIAAARAVFPALPEGEAAWRQHGFLVGAPEDVWTALLEWRAAGVERVLLQMLDQEDLGALELFARRVIPALG
jgi:alkanesulfonate monooxygenase SsuD/methylene tetrahydromethanopterin reductase-like flavin-dependent oxidoreductase (luciferase family)